MEGKKIFTNSIIYTNGVFVEGSVGVEDGKIIEINENPRLEDYDEVIDLQGNYLLPGMIDPHIHIREPGRPDRGTFFTETQAAAAGGVTTILEHPIAKPPQYNKDVLASRQKDASNKCVVDYAFYGAAGALYPEKIAEMGETGIVAFKSFLHEAPEGRDEEFIGLTMANDGQMYLGFREVAKTGKLLAVHAENNDIISTLINKYREEGKTSPIYHCKSRPKFAEYETVAKLLLFAKDTGVKFILCHISAPESMEMIKKAKEEGLEVYLETCPHYLYLTEDALEEHGSYAKCNPALRAQEDVDKLWDYVADGTVDFIGSDHATYTVEEKERSKEDIFVAPAGFIGVDLRLSLMLQAYHDGKVTLERAIDLMSPNVAKAFGIYPQKGSISLGSDADFVVVDLDKEWTVDKDKFYSKAKEIGKVFDGWKLKGKAIKTVVRGRVVMEDGIVDEEAKGWGQLVEAYNEQ